MTVCLGVTLQVGAFEHLAKTKAAIPAPSQGCSCTQQRRAPIPAVSFGSVWCCTHCSASAQAQLLAVAS